MNRKKKKTHFKSPPQSNNDPVSDKPTNAGDGPNTNVEMPKDGVGDGFQTDRRP